MTRLQLLRAVVDVVEVLDKHVVEEAATDAIVAASDHEDEVRRALGLGPDHRERTVDAATRVMNRVADLYEQVQSASKDVDDLNNMAHFFGVASRREVLEKVLKTAAIAKAPLDSDLRAALLARPDESTMAAAERLKSRVVDLVHEIDDRDKQIAQALGGMFPGEPAERAITMLVQLARSLQERLKEKADAPE